jgi:hypothetical protein
MVLRRNPNAAFRVYDGQATVVLPDRAMVHVLNELGSSVWEAIDGTRSVGQIIESVVDEYDVEPGRAHTEVLEFLAALLEQGMVN